MPLTVTVKPRARREIMAAAAWWRENRPAAARAVATDLENAFELLSQFPSIGTKVANSRDPETRRWHLKRLGYDIYYRPRGELLEVVAFWHGSREHGPAV